jgi:hypothetical protein
VTQKLSAKTGLLVAQKSLAKTRSLVPQKLSAKNKVVGDTKIINENKFHDWRMESLANTTTVDLEIVSKYNHCWLRNRQRKLSRYQPRNHQRKQIPRLTLGIINEHNPLLTQKSSMETKSLPT